MRICHITPTFYPSIGGIEDVVLNLALEQKRTGHDAWVVVAHPGVKTFSEQEVQGIRTLYCPVLGNRMVGLIRNMSSALAGADLLHVHDPQVSLITGNVLRFAKVPKVLNTHGGFLHTKDRLLAKKIHAKFFVPQLLKSFGSIIADSASDGKFFDRYSQNVTVIENGVDVQKFGGLATPQSGLSRWLYWGRLSKNKRVDAIIRMVAQARSNGLNVELSIAGGDFAGESGFLAQLVRELGLQNHVRFLGLLAIVPLKALISESDLYLTASEYEGFGVGIVEALSAGLPVFCRDMHPVNVFVEDCRNGGYLRFDGSPDDAKKISMFANMSQSEIDQLSARAQEVASRYSWDLVWVNVAKAYDKAMTSVREEQ